MADQPPLPLANADRIRAIAEVALTSLRSHRGSRFDRGVSYDERRERREVAVCALRFCAAAAGQLGNPALMDVLVTMIDAFASFDRIEEAAVDDLAEGITSLLRRGAPVTPDVVRLARHRDDRIRTGVAEGLPATDDTALALLQELAADPSPGVRRAARDAIGDRVALPWWLGKWSRDPADLGADAHHTETLKRLAAILDGRRWEIYGKRADILALAATLPDALAVDLTEMLLRTDDTGAMGDTDVAALMLSRPGGGDALLRLVRRWDGDDKAAYRAKQIMGAVLAAVPYADHTAIVQALVRLALAGTPEERSEHVSAPVIAAEIAAQAWREGEDTEPLLDALLALEAETKRHDRVKSHLAGVLQHPPSDPTRMRARALSARAEGYGGRYAGVSGALEKMLAAVGEGAMEGKEP